MWNPECNEDSSAILGQKCFESADSGFLSGCNSNTCSSEYSSKSTSEDIQPAIAPSPMKALDSGIDCGLTDCFDQLTLRQNTLNPLHLGNQASNTPQLEPITETANYANCANSRRESHQSNADKLVLGNYQPWQLYFIQNEEGDT